MNILSYPSARVELSEVTDCERTETPYRKMVYLACLRALAQTPYEWPTPLMWNAGILFQTVLGENFPVAWFNTVVRNGGRLRPRAFEGCVHTSAPGYASIRMGITGPMIVLTTIGNVDDLARLELETGRSKFMFVCSAELEGPALCYVMVAL